jgi:hypothetical protein
MGQTIHMKKKPFLLIEVLIALSLVTLCIGPLVRQPLKMYQIEVGKLESLEKERIADWAFTEVKERLLKNEIPWEKLPHKYQFSDSFPLPEKTLDLPGRPLKKMKCSFYLEGTGEKTGKNRADCRQFKVMVSLDNSTYEFRLPVKKIIDP